MNSKTELYENLDAFDPKWQSHYRSLAEAARAAQVTHLLLAYLATGEGMRYTQSVASLPDVATANEVFKRHFGKAFASVSKVSHNDY